MTTSKRRLPIWAALLGTGCAGALVAVQTRINGGLSQRIDNGYLAAAISFCTGLLILWVIVLLSRRGRAGLRLVKQQVSSGHLPRWTLIGGAFGAFYVLGQGLVATVIGLALFTVGIVAGQVLGGLLIDRIGVGPGGRIDPSMPRIVGTLLAVAAVALSVLADLLGPGEYSGRVWLVLLPIAIGVGVAFQMAVNGLVRAAAQSAIVSAFISFAVGSAVLVVAAAVSVAVSGWPQHWPHEPLYYVGGALGVVFLALAAVLVRTAGVLLLGMSNVAGQLLASVALEAGLPLAGGVSAGLLAGAALALVAVTVAAIPSRTRQAAD